MKILLTVLLFFGAVSAEASGKLSLQNNFFQDLDGKGHTYRPMVGLGIYEFIFRKKVALNSWVGYGNQPLELTPDVNWFTAKVQLDFFVGDFTLAPGVQYSYIPTYHEDRLNPYLKIDYRLW